MAKVPNAAMWWVLGGATLFLTLILSVPFLRNLFKFSILHPVDIAICIGAGLLSIAAFELVKLQGRRKSQ
jgi:Ca2+-transporting ATPase